MRSKIDFQKLDSDDPSNSKLKEKYGIIHYPQFVFTDNSGKALLNQGGAPSSSADFLEMIGRFVK